MGNVKAKGRFEFQCEGCGRMHSRSCGELAWNCVETQPRQLGHENRFVASWKEQCPCGAEMGMEFWVKEYPVNSLNGQGVEPVGAKVLKACSIGLKETLY